MQSFSYEELKLIQCLIYCYNSFKFPLGIETKFLNKERVEMLFAGTLVLWLLFCIIASIIGREDIIYPASYVVVPILVIGFFAVIFDIVDDL